MDLMERIARNLPRIRTHGSVFSEDKQRYNKKKIEAVVSVANIRYRSIRAELIKLIVEFNKLNIFAETSENIIPLDVRFYADGGSSCSLPIHCGLCWIYYDHSYAAHRI